MATPELGLPESTESAPPARPNLSLPRLLQWILILITVAALSVASIIGVILVLATGPPAVGILRLLGVIGLLGLFGLAALGCTIALDHGASALGWVGLAASAIGYLLSVILVLSSAPDETLAKVLAVVGNLASTVALASLLLLVRRRTRGIDVLIALTMVALTILYIFQIIQTFNEEALGAGLIKGLGVVIILAFLGMIATPLLARLVALRHPVGAPDAAGSPPGPPPRPMEPTGT
jgi:hypothetical protein